MRVDFQKSKQCSSIFGAVERNKVVRPDISMDTDGNSPLSTVEKNTGRSEMQPKSDAEDKWHVDQVCPSSFCILSEH